MKGTDRLARWAALLSGVIILIITLLISFDVGMRYLFDSPQLFVDELSGFLQVALIFLGLAYAFTTGAHVRVDLLTTRLAGPVRARLRLFTLSVGLVLVLVVSWVTARSAHTAFDYGRVSTVELYPLWIPMVMIPLGLLLFAVVLAAALRRQWQGGRRRGPQADEIRPSELPETGPGEVPN